MKQETKEQLSVAHKFFEKIMGKGDLSIYDQIIASDASGHCPESWKGIHSTEVYGRENTKLVDQQYTKAFQSLGIHITEIVSVENQVFAKWDCEKIHKDFFYGIKGTNRKLSMTGQTFLRFQNDGKIKEVWQSWDMLGLLHQIGWQPTYAMEVDGCKLNILLKNASGLTQREKDCLRLFIKGKTAKDTAAILFVSPRTVEYYFELIKNKLMCVNKKEVFFVARILEKHGFL